MAKPDLGTKHQCQNCGTKFFDLHKTPIVCPKCGTVFQGASPVSRAAARAAATDDDEEVEAETGAEVVSLEDAEAEEKVTVSVEDEADIDDDAAEDDTFLEEEEEDGDNVTDLIDGDIEDDEER